jgi:ABC-type transport system involved in multi-copper enzyme maturation permease subunit
MTALTWPARPEYNAALRPLPWRRMAWVTWRQHRIAMGGAVLLLGGLALFLWLTGLPIHQAWTAAATCRPASSVACFQASNLITSKYVPQEVVAGFLLTLAPALLGAFVGAPVLARELETGTFRYAWTQGIGRSRWTLGKLVPLAIAVAAAAGALSVLSWWYFQPFFGVHFGTPLAPALFDLRGVAYAAWTLAAFTIAALLGMLIRRVVPAIAATLAAYLGLALLPGLWLRQHYLAPVLSTSNTVPSSAWILDQWYTKGGKFAFAVPQKSGTIAGLIHQHCPSASGNLTLGQCLAQHGYTQWTSYQPVTRFWPFQGIEAGWLVALSALLIAATIWLVRRRAA